MKRVLVMALVLLLCLSCSHAEIGDTVKASEDGHVDIVFDNGYTGYDTDYYNDHVASKDDEFIEEGTDVAVSNASGKAVGNFLKIFFVEFYDLAMEEKSKTQHIIWHFTDDFNSWRVDPQKMEEIRTVANTKIIPDHGAIKKLADGTELIFDFICLQAKKTGNADFFGYKITEVVTVNEYENTKMQVDAQSNVNYLWQIERGNGWEDIPYAQTETLSYSRASRAHDGFRFRCKMTDNNGDITYSNEFLLKVIPYVPDDGEGDGDEITPPESNTPPAGNTPPPASEELPKTGDPAPLALCAALLALSAAAFLYLRKRQIN